MVSLTTYNRSAYKKREEIEEEKNSELGSLKLSKERNSGAEVKNHSVLIDQSEQNLQNRQESKLLVTPF